MKLSTVCLVIISPINVVLNIVLVHFTALGLLGSPLALSITYWLAFIILAVLTVKSKHHKTNQTWGGIDIKETFNPSALWQFSKLALPGILMVGTEW